MARRSEYPFSKLLAVTLLQQISEKLILQFSEIKEPTDFGK